MYPYLGSQLATFIVQAISRIFSIFALIFTCISARVIKSAICFLFYTIFPTLKSTMLVMNLCKALKHFANIYKVG